MRFGIINEAAMSRGISYGVRYHEVIKEAVLADELGFEFFGSSEQHFVPTAYTVSAPDVLYAAIAALTSNIKLRHMSVVALTAINHPVRIAERLATLDIIAKGRLEFGTARSNNFPQLKTFKVDPTTTRAEWREVLEATVVAWMESPAEFHGKFVDFDPVHVVPRLYQPTCPPIFVSATSPETHRTAGELGIGAMTFDNWFGWEYLEDCVKEYRRGLQNAQPIRGLYDVNARSSFLTFPAHCASTRKQAVDEARSTVMGLFESVAGLYMDLANAEAGKGGSSYKYLRRMQELDAKKHDFDYLIKASPGLLIGDPDDVIATLKQYEKLGIDEVILKIDSYGHRTNLRSMEMFAKYVMPEFRHPGGIPPVADDWKHAAGVGEHFQL